MELWNIWLELVNQFESACSRKRTFFWLITILIGFTVKFDFLGVTSIARAVGLLPCYYTCVLNFFNSTSVDLKKLQSLWIKLIFSRFAGLIKINGRCLIIGDGIKVGKEGKKMPGVKWLHQDSDSNSKAEYIMGHSIQAIAILAKGLSTSFAIPLLGEIHEGIRFSCKDSRTLLDKMFEMLIRLKLPEKFYFIADKYYCSGRFMKQLIASDIHIITMMKKNAVAYYPEKSKVKRLGRPKKYGKKVKLFDLFKTNLNFVSVPMPGNNKLMIEYYVVQLFWKPLGDLAQFVYVRHPERGNAISMSTDLTLAPLDIIFCYSLRFKIEVLFKQAVHQVGAFMYRFWLKVMKPRKRGSGEQVIHFAPATFKKNISRKLNAYHLFIQLGFISQGLMQYLSIHCHQFVWGNFGTWLRTIRRDTLPSEKVVALAMSRTYLGFFIDESKDSIFKKFLRARVDLNQILPVSVHQKEAA
jgi:Transposase DDE domain